MKKNYNEVVRNSCKQVHEIIKNYFHNKEVTNENDFSEVYSAIELKRMSIPKEIFEEIDSFIQNNIAPLVYDYDNVFASMHSPENGYFDDEKGFCIETEEQTKRFFTEYFAIIFEVEKKWDDFAMETLYPIITS